MIGDAFGAELNAGVRPLPPEQLELHPQLEITIRLRGAEELVARNLARQRPTDNGAVLDTEDLEIPLPAGKRLSVKHRVALRLRLAPAARPLHRVGQQRLERLMVVR